MDMPANAQPASAQPADVQPASAQPAGVPDTQASQAVAQMARFWWLWLISGFVWMIAAVMILQFDRRSVTLVGIIIGIMFLVAGLEELALAFLAPGGWKWFWGIFGVLLFGGGLWALFNPTHTFLAISNILGFVFILIGAGWTTRAIATRQGDTLWWLGLMSGIIMLGLGFWAAGQVLVTQAYVLLLFAGVWGLLHGITDIIKAFAIRGLTREVAM